MPAIRQPDDGHLVFRSFLSRKHIKSIPMENTVYFGRVYSLFRVGLQSVFSQFTDCFLPVYSL